MRLHSPWLREQLHLVPGVLVREEQGRRELAVPYDVGRPFPLTALFCFAHIRRIHGRSYAIFAFNGEERPGVLSRPADQRHFQKIPNDVFHISRGYDIITPRRAVAEGLSARPQTREDLPAGRRRSVWRSSMKCPYCGYSESKVIDSRPADENSSIRRRRECLSWRQAIYHL